MSIGILFPHQLLEENSIVSTCTTIYLVEEWLFFKQYNFHKQKVAFHRASMKYYENYFKSKKIEVIYIDAFSELSDIRKLIPYLKEQCIESFTYIDTTDCWLEERITKAATASNIQANKISSTLFLNTPQDIDAYFSGKKRLFQTDFYKHQRISRNILLDKDSKPIGGKWTYDDENRLKYPKGKIPPQVDFMKPNRFYSEAVTYVETYFPNNYGLLQVDFIYPTTHEESKSWLEAFFKKRLVEFGSYEDAIVSNQHVLHHGVLTPMLNVGLLTPQFIIDQALVFAEAHDLPINSVEGFVRQIIGWREFIRAVYELKGSEARTKNYWGFTRKIPPSFWNGTTGIEPIDNTIKKVLEAGYCHHIERLMVLGNFMLLCEFDPDEVYRWFMELFIDAYDWVMVPNVYGMSQFADGGLFATKPYISGSNYLMKMSDYKKGNWQPIWDGLFWRFMHVHRDFFLQNPRLGMLVKTFDKMDEHKKTAHLNHAEKFIESLSE
ncbi:cryptochrome/photolyase family protein [uncultured Cytophaga sp.]|uniref:cryptochrome/photolyase family protein n=1 Tax=uncultured Cytophaga sp. TaxID=160238 RepID=UPI00261FB37A|nr:cryptochrome/photolyase family protein [uncultured Cytophaga sp.]